jgi:hypothetical protein
MSAYTPPANWNPIFDPKKFFNIPTGNMPSAQDQQYTADLITIDSELSEAYSLLSQFSTSSSIRPQQSNLTANTTETLYSLYGIPSGVKVITLNCLIQFPNIIWNYAVIWLRQSIGGVITNTQPSAVFGYLNATNGIMLRNTISTTFFLNNNVAMGVNDFIQIQIKVYAPTNLSYTAWTVPLVNGNGATLSYTQVTDAINPFMV